MNHTWVASWWSESGWACATSQPQSGTGATVFGTYLAHVTLFPPWHLSQSKSEAPADDDRVAARAPDTLPKGASVAALASHPFVATMELGDLGLSTERNSDDLGRWGCDDVKCTSKA